MRFMSLERRKEIIRLDFGLNNNCKYYMISDILDELKEANNYEDIIYSPDINYNLIFEYLDLFHSYIGNIIDTSDYFITDTYDKEIKKQFKKIKHKDYLYNDNILIRKIRLYDIRKEDEKEKLKNRIKFNLCGYDNLPVIIPKERSYVLNKTYNTHQIIDFYKDNKLLFKFSFSSGEIWDNRKGEDIVKHIKEYNKKIKKI